MSRIEEIWEMARHRGTLAVKVVYPDGGFKSYLTDGGSEPPSRTVILYGDKEEEVFNLFRYPEYKSKVVSEYFNKKFLEDESFRQRYWSDQYSVREELREQFKNQLYSEAKAILTVPQPAEVPNKPIAVQMSSEKKEEDVKPIYKSRTIVGNIIAAIIVSTAAKFGLSMSEEQVAQLVSIIFMLLNMFFRAITDKPVR